MRALEPERAELQAHGRPSSSSSPDLLGSKSCGKALPLVAERALLSSTRLQTTIERSLGPGRAELRTHDRTFSSTSSTSLSTQRRAVARPFSVFRPGRLADRLSGQRRMRGKYRRVLESARAGRAVDLARSSHCIAPPRALPPYRLTPRPSSRRHARRPYPRPPPPPTPRAVPHEARGS